MFKIVNVFINANYIKCATNSEICKNENWGRQTDRLAFL